MSLNLDPTSAPSVAPVAPTTSINLSKGERINLSKAQPGLTRIRIGLGWDIKPGLSADLDASALLLGANDKMIPGEVSPGKPRGIVFYNNLLSENAAVKHSGDNRTGAGEGDDETIVVDLTKLSTDVKAVLAVITSFSDAAPVTFGVVKNAIARIYNDETGAELYKFELAEDNSMATAMEMVRIYRGDTGEWKLTSLGDSLGHQNNGLADIVAKFS